MSRKKRRSGAPEHDDWRSYRCPVCGHVDDVAVPAGRALPIRCSHCDTALNVTRDPGSSERVSVQVATGEGEGSEGS